MFGDIGKMMKEAQQLQARMAEAQEEIARIEATGTSGGGLVSVTVTGKGEMKGLRIDPSLLKPEEAEIVEDLIVAAFTDARVHVDGLVAERMKTVNRQPAAASRLQIAFPELY